MKKLIIILILSVSLCASTTAYAGTINSCEQDILSAAQGTFEYQGRNYKLDSAYVNQLYDYLSGDDIDLTAGDRDVVLQSIQGNIEKGVKEGYLKPIDNSASSQPGTGSSDTDNQSPKDSQNITGTDPDTFVYKDNSSQDTSTESSEDMLDDWFIDEDQVNDASVSPDQTVAADVNNSSDNKDASIASTSDLAVDNAMNHPIIKNTGFDLSLTIAMVAFLGVIMFAAICVTVRYHYFAQYDE